MDCTLEEYMENVLSQLTCNASEEHKAKHYISYDYTNNEVNAHVGYFRRCLEAGLSAYKALLFFGDYLEGDYDI